MLVELLESGLFDAEQVQAIIDRFVAEKQALQARRAARTFLDRAFWNHRVSDADLLAEAGQVPACAGLLDPYVVPQLFDTLSELPDGQALGRAIVDAWISAFAARDHQDLDDDNPFSNPIHPDIKAAFDAAKTRIQASATVVGACTDIIETAGECRLFA